MIRTNLFYALNLACEGCVVRLLRKKERDRVCRYECEGSVIGASIDSQPNHEVQIALTWERDFWPSGPSLEQVPGGGFEG